MEEITSRLDYDPETGVLIWKTGNRKGKIAGSPQPTHRVIYKKIWVDGKYYFAHRIAWLLMTGRWPLQQIDHKNGDGEDNRWCNIREATPLQNRWNVGPRTDSKLGIKGIRYKPKKGTYRVRIRVNGKRIEFGYYKTAEQAAEAYRKIALEVHGEFARCGRS